MTNEEFAEIFKARTKKWAIETVKYVMTLPETPATRVIRYQLIKSSTSTAANYRAACRGRSKPEFYAKIGIALEEADESLFWMEFIQESEIDNSTKLHELMKEALEIVSVLAKIRKNANQ